MSRPFLQVTYREGRPLAAYIYLGHEPGLTAARTRQVRPDLLVDYAADGRPLGIEVVTPAAVSREEIEGVFRRLGLPRPGPADLEPLRVGRGEEA